MASFFTEEGEKKIILGAKVLYYILKAQSLVKTASLLIFYNLIR
jgi:hypothetical protein